MYVENPIEWGTKRACRSCAAKFYDMQRSPAVCPKCQTEFVEVAPKTRSSGAKSAQGRSRNSATPFGHGQGPWTRRTGSHSPFAEARSANEDGAPEGKVPDDGDAEDGADKEKEVESSAGEGEDEQSR
jgi:uncharacterized protein (TIGR02300 family)